MRLTLRLCMLWWLGTIFGPATQAKVLNVEITSQTDILGGTQYGAAGSYERLTGNVFFSVGVDEPHNASIVDLRNATNLADGAVTFAADFIAVRPKNGRQGNGSIVLEIPNRGHGRIIALADGGDWDLAHDAGDAWLLRNGYTIVTLGWQWDAAGDDALKLHAPIARENGKRIEGLLRGDLMLSSTMDEIPLGHLILGTIGGTEYPVAAPEDERDELSVRDSRYAPRMMIPRSAWRFAHTVNGKLQPSDRHIHLQGGFQPGRIYEYVYVVSDPIVAGLGFAAVRDFAAYVKHSRGALIQGSRVYGLGISQNGRFLRDFVYQGFNADEQGRMALDGILAHVAGAGRGSFNFRFAQPSRDAQPTSAVFYPTDVFPFTDLPETDPASGEVGGLLDHAARDHVVPKIFFSNTSYEYWGRAASLIHTSADAESDARISPNVRIYHLTGLQHFSGPFPPARGTGDLFGRAPESPLPIRYLWRSMIANMDRWVRAATTPPPSSYPRIADHTLVTLREYSFPAIPGVARPRELSEAVRLDFGPDWRQGILSKQPPAVGQPYPSRVPQVDADGNERDGVRLPEIILPLATYTGWNLRDPSIGAPDQRVAFEGSYIPFPRTAEERRKSEDPRKSVAERYRNRDDYLQRYRHAVDELVKERWILPEDRDSLLQRGEREWDLATAASNEAGQPGT